MSRPRIDGHRIDGHRVEGRRVEGPGAGFTDVFASALRGEACRLLGLPPGVTPWPLDAWRGPVEGDVALADQCVGTCVDLGCGPGRLTELLALRGHVVLGVDLVPEAVFQTRDRGVAALLRDLFEPLPREGHWQTALLADGNIGIGGDPLTLLRRVAELLAPHGRAVVDLAPPGTGVLTRQVWLETDAHRSAPFPWAVVGVEAIWSLAWSAGFGEPRVHRHGQRWYAVLPKGI